MSKRAKSWFEIGVGLILSKIFVDMSSVFDPGFSLITFSCELVSFLNHPEVIELYYLSVIQLCHIGNSGNLMGDETLL